MIGEQLLRNSAEAFICIRSGEWMQMVLPAFKGERMCLPRLKYLRWCSYQVHNLVASLARLNSPIKESLEFTETSSLTLREQMLNSRNGLLGLTVTLRVTGTRSNVLKVPLVYEFRKHRRGKARPVICDQCIWPSELAKGGHQTSDHWLGGFR